MYLKENCTHPLLAHCRIPPRLSSFLHAFLIITPGQYCISGGKNGGLEIALSLGLGLNVNLSTNENTFLFLDGFELEPDAFSSLFPSPSASPSPSSGP